MEDGAVESVCQTALSLGCVDVKRISRMLKQFSVDRSHRAATTSCSSVCRSRAHAGRAMRTSARERDDEHRDFSRARLGASRRLRLGRMIDTLPDRIALAATQSMPFEELLRSCSPTRSRGAARPPSTTASQRRSSIPTCASSASTRTPRSPSIRKLFNELCSLTISASASARRHSRSRRRRQDFHRQHARPPRVSTSLRRPLLARRRDALDSKRADSTTRTTPRWPRSARSTCSSSTTSRSSR